MLRSNCDVIGTYGEWLATRQHRWAASLSPLSLLPSPEEIIFRWFPMRCYLIVCLYTCLCEGMCTYSHPFVFSAFNSRLQPQLIYFSFSSKGRFSSDIKMAFLTILILNKFILLSSKLVLGISCIWAMFCVHRPQHVLESAQISTQRISFWRVFLIGY